MRGDEREIGRTKILYSCILGIHHTKYTMIHHTGYTVIHYTGYTVIHYTGYTVIHYTGYTLYRVSNDESIVFCGSHVFYLSFFQMNIFNSDVLYTI